MNALDTYKQILPEFLAFRSISTDSSYRPEITKTATWLGQLLESYGFEVETWKSSGLNPVICARYQVADPQAKTILVYGHYDVQPAAKADGWQSDPFQMDERNGRLFGRGVVDNKGQVLVHIVTVAALIADGTLAHNVTFLIEGDEETGSAGIGTVLTAHREALSCDHVLISDGEIPYRPTIEASLRGSFNLRVHYRTAATNLHSGLYGGGLPNAAQELTRVVGGLYDTHNRVTVPGFYDDMDQITPAQRQETQALYIGDERLRSVTGVRTPLFDDAYDFSTATSLLPSLEVTGVASGYTGEGFANIIPAEAEARINVRTVASQSTKKLYAAIERYIQQQTPDYVSCTVKMDMACDPIKLPTDSALVRQVQKLLRATYDEDPLLSYCGASIPIVSEIKATLGKDCLLVSLGNDDCNMHGVDENFDIGLLEKGLAFSQRFFSSNL